MRNLIKATLAILTFFALTAHAQSSLTPLDLTGPATATATAIASKTGVTGESVPMAEWIDKQNSANDLLCALIGDPGGLGVFGSCAASETASALHQIIKTANIAIFSLAILFFAWNVVSATVSGATDGTFIGKKNNSSWVPIRTVWGLSLLVPAFGGFSLAQLLMVWAAAVGVGIAGAGAASISGKVPSLVSHYSTPAGLSRAEDFSQMLWDRAFCVARYSQHTRDLSSAGTEDAEATSLSWGHVISLADTGVLIEYGATPERGGYAKNTCGTVTIGLQKPDDMGDPRARSIVEAVQSAVKANAGQLAATYTQQAVDSLADERVSKEDVERALKLANDSYNKAIERAAVGATNAANAAAVADSGIDKGNWIGIGFHSVQAATSSYTVTNAAAAKPVTVGGAVEVEGGRSFWDSTKSFFGSVKDAVVNTAEGVASLTGITDAFDKELNAKVGNLGESIAKAIDTKASVGSPMQMLIGLGLEVTRWVAGLLPWFLLFTIPIIVLSAPIPGVSGLITVAGIALMGLAVPLFFFGIKLAAYLPFLVAIIWSGAIMGWLVIVFEALLAAPLWAMIHLDMDGEGMGQRTGHGYVFLLNLLFRPVFMVGSYIFAMGLMSVIFGLFAGSVADMITGLASKSTDWWASLILIIGAIWVVVMAAEQFATQSLSLIFQVPDKVFTWIGGQMGSNVGANLEANAERHIKGGLDKAASGLAQTGQAAAAFGGDSVRAGGAALKKWSESRKNGGGKVEAGSAGGGGKRTGSAE